VFFTECAHQEVLKRFCKFSGVPRFIFIQPEQHEQNLADAIATVDLGTCIKSIGQTDSHQEISHYLVQIVPSTNYRSRTISFLSPEVGDTVSKMFLNRNHAELVNFLKTSMTPGFGALATYRGFLYEAWIHNVICKGGKFTVCGPIGSPHECEVELTIPCCEKQRVQDWVTPKPNTYYQPISKVYGGVDSWIPGIGLFQITTAESHEINTFETGKMISKSNITSLYFIVPLERYRNFKRQNVKTTGRKRKQDEESKLEHYSFLLDQVQQFVLVIDWDMEIKKFEH